MLRSLNYPTDIDVFFFIGKMIQEEGLYVYNINNIVEKHFNICIAPVRRRGESLVIIQARIKSIPISKFNNSYNWAINIQSTTCQTIYFRLCTTLISSALAPNSICKCIA
jgi:hypothetical protein